jgi:hypothetical protein
MANNPNRNKLRREFEREKLHAQWVEEWKAAHPEEAKTEPYPETAAVIWKMKQQGR